MLLIALLLYSAAVSDSPTTLNADALVLVNSTSANYSDFQRYVQPYLDHLGVPYTILDISTAQISSAISNHALIIVGHRLLDPTGTTLDSNEQSEIGLAVQQGTGLVNFDSRLTLTMTTPRYLFIQAIFNFTYGNTTIGKSVTYPVGTTHFITQNRTPGSTTLTENMALAGILGSGTSTVLATTGTQPFLAVATYGFGRAVQWGSISWMSHPVKGPMYELDDVLWRSLVWAARKPFPMRSIPPFLIMRIDDVSGPFDWIHVANEFGFRPWAGLFYPYISAQNATDLSSLVNAGWATASPHAKNTLTYFYRNYGVGDFPDAVISQNFTEATAWHSAYNIPISKYVVAHNYEFGTNVFQGLKDWGVEYLGTCINIGVNHVGATWLMKRPFRLYESATFSVRRPFFYSDFMEVPNHPEFNGEFFNVITEIRDDAGYEWSVDLNDIAGTTLRGTRQTKRAFDAKALAVLFSHEPLFVPGWNATSAANWRAILQNITTNLASYHPRLVTMDYAAQYLRALRTSTLGSLTYDPILGTATATLSGNTDLTTAFSVHLSDEQVVDIDVPAFTSSTVVEFQIPSVGLDHFEIETVGSPQTVSAPFNVTIRARDDQGGLVTSFNGTALISDTTHTVMPVSLGPFYEGVWTGQVSIGVEASAVTLTVVNGSTVGTSNAFAVTAPSASLVYVGLDHATVLGGDSSTGTVTLDIPAPVGGAEIALSSDNAAAQVPASVTVLEGQTTATFQVTTSPVTVNTPVVISALYNAVTRTANLTVNISTPTLTSFSLNPETVVGGSTSTGTVTLSGPAPLGGAVVTLFSSITAVAQVPANVTVPAGSRTATFLVTTTPVVSNSRPTLTAAYGGTSRQTRLMVTAPVPISNTINPSTVQGGTPSTGTITLDGPAPAGGLLVTLSSNRTAVAQVPASITIPAGERTAPYTITTYATTTTRTATISARGGGVTVRADITVTP